VIEIDYRLAMPNHAISIADGAIKCWESEVYGDSKKDLLVYLRNNRSRMLYGQYRRRGLMIGSGPIESAHRNVIQQRLKLAGQRWSEPGAQAVLNLRLLHKSGHWSALVSETCQLKRAA
jgi:hypothetical protein